MESEKTNKILFYVIPAAVLVVIIILVVVSSLSPKKNIVPTPGSSVLPTLMPRNNASSASQSQSSSQQPAGSLTPTLVPVRPFTGVTDPQIPKEANDLAIQKQALVDKMPFSHPFFTIAFDFSQDKFTVTLKDPKQTSRAAFESWLKDNYPNIPLDRFILK